MIVIKGCLKIKIINVFLVYKMNITMDLQENASNVMTLIAWFVKERINVIYVRRDLICKMVNANNI